ncbi:MAG: class I SAM-dependent methyltransferase [Candidatus Omnitrophica bacterium]|nr:class I SAM-dependent methyltransferase [Candidatus Omnitrophota bacterium]
MTDPAAFYNARYALLDGDETKAMDHAFYRFLLPFAKTRIDVACQMIGTNTYPEVADVGCGPCQIAVRKLNQFGHYTGFDISSYRLDGIPASLKTNPKLSVVQHNLNDPIPSKDHSFNLVICLSTIEYLFDPFAFLKELHRILVPQGVLIIHTMNVAYLPRRLESLLGKLPTFNKFPAWEGGILHRFTYPTMKTLLQGQGFKILESQCAGILPATRMWWPNLLAGDMIFRAIKN